jgi:glycosyltransferase involved in cell wall biosynthesis
MISLIRRLLSKDELPYKRVAQTVDIEYFGNVESANVLIFTEHVNATYYISFDIPLRALYERGEVNFAVISQEGMKEASAATDPQTVLARWYETYKPEVVILTRYAIPHGSTILEFFRHRGVPVIYHIDDDLLEIPTSLGKEINNRQGSDTVVEARRYLLGHCDLIYASTSYLAGILSERFPKQKVIHGEIYAPFMGERLRGIKVKARDYPVIGYMGSKGHQHDLALVVPSLVKLMEQYTDLHFETFGTIQLPEELRRFKGRVRGYSVQKSYLDFLTALKQLRWDVGLAPLIDIPFNRSKAPTKYIEYTACDISVVASNLPVYAQVTPVHGVLLADEDWYELLCDLLNNFEMRQEMLAVSHSHCAQMFSTSALEAQVFKIIKSVCNF